MLASPHTTPSLLPLSWRITKAVLAWPVRVVTARRILGQVASMSDRELRDIGLTRHDVRDATALPLATDPGRLFQARVHERLAVRLDSWRSDPRPIATATLKPVPTMRRAERVSGTDLPRFRPTAVTPTFVRR